MFGYMEFFYIGAGLGRLLLIMLNLSVRLKVLGEKFVISKILHLSLQRDFKVITFKHKFNIQIQRKNERIKIITSRYKET